MLRFVTGFVTASLLWGGLFYAHSQGLIDISLEPDAPPEVAESAASSESDVTPQKGKRRKRSNTRKPRGTNVSGTSQTGDDLGEDGARTLDMNAGEQQLRDSEIEQGFEGAFPSIRRCLVLAAGDDLVRGKVVFGLRITGAGRVSRVNLNGPSAVTQGEAGACLRKAASAMRFRTFDGPDMVVHYPLTLE